MKRVVVSLTVCFTLSLSLNGCGGGGSSDSPSLESSSNSTPKVPKSSPPPSSSNFNSLIINPLKELGLTAGDQVCFSVKSYNNTIESEFSKAICGKINDSNKLTLSWNKTSGDVIGYYVYYGKNKNNATNFLADVIES